MNRQGHSNKPKNLTALRAASVALVGRRKGQVKVGPLGVKR